MAQEFHEALLTPKSMKAFRMRLLQYPFLRHKTRPECVRDIRSGGLKAMEQPDLPQGMDLRTQSAIRDAFGDPPRMLCMSHESWGAAFAMVGWKCGDVQLAVATTDLPDTVWLDWSYSHLWNAASQLEFEESKRSPEDFAHLLCQRFASVAIAGVIDPKCVRVQAPGCAYCAPADWPLVTAEEFANGWPG